MEYYSAIKKNEILPFVTMWMDLEGITVSKVSQTERQIVWFPYMKNLKNKTNEQTQQNGNRLVDKKNKHMGTRGEGDEGENK